MASAHAAETKNADKMITHANRHIISLKLLLSVRGLRLRRLGDLGRYLVHAGRRKAADTTLYRKARENLSVPRPAPSDAFDSPSHSPQGAPSTKRKRPRTRTGLTSTPCGAVVHAKPLWTKRSSISSRTTASLLSLSSPYLESDVSSL
jgi:hypothetical protein